MLPFRVTCVTCSARLAVRNEGLIGKILACPKCGSMVLVERPAATSSAADSFESHAPPQLSASELSPLGPRETPVFDDVGSSLDASAPPAEHASPTAPLTTEVAPRPASVGKTAAILSGGALAGVVLVAGAMKIWFSPVVAPVPVVADASALRAGNGAQPVDDPAPVYGAPIVEESGDDSSLPGGEPVPELPDDQSGAPAVGEQGDADARVAIAANPFAEFSDDPPVDQDADPASVPAPVEAPDNEPRLIVEPPEQAQRAIDPLDLDPEGLNLSSLFSPRPPVTRAIAADETAENSFAAENVAEEPHPGDEDQGKEAARPRASAVQRESIGVGVRRPDALAAKSIFLDGIRLKKTPLCQFLDFATQLSGVPVSVAPDQLELAGISAAKGISVDVEGAEFEEMLATALKPLRLAPRFEADQIVLERVGLPKRRTIDYRVGDLAGGAATVADVAAWVRALVAPESWQEAGGDAALEVTDDALAINAPERVQYDVLLLLERIRKARGLAAKSRYPAALVAAHSPYIDLAEKLGAPATFTFTEYAPLREVFRHCQEELGLGVLVDWPALADGKLWPQARISCSQNNVPWSEALDAVLEPLDLGWRAVDARTIEITSRVRLDVQTETHLYPAASPPTSSAIRVGDGLYAVRATADEHRRLATRPSAD